MKFVQTISNPADVTTKNNSNLSKSYRDPKQIERKIAQNTARSSKKD